MDHESAYRSVRDRIVGLVAEDNADTRVPTCPGWTVKDVIAHCAGFFTAYKKGDPKTAFGPTWGDDAVDERRDLSLQETIADWDRQLADPAGLFESQLAPVAVSDVLAHEQDIRTALNKPGGMDDENIVPAVQMGLAFLGKKVEAGGLPPIKIVTDDLDTQIGEGDPVATLHTSTFELFRTIHGRRTPEQLESMKWDGDPGKWTEEMFLFGPTKERVEG